MDTVKKSFACIMAVMLPSVILPYMQTRPYFWGVSASTKNSLSSVKSCIEERGHFEKLDFN